jgi:Ca2+-binding RTX toxin-like protein
VSTTAGGEVDFALARYDADGTPDRTLSEDGFQTTDFGSGDVAFGTAVGPDAKIVLGGVTYGSGDFAVARYNTDGSLDATPAPPAPTAPAPSTGCTITGTGGNDVIYGTPGRDIICAGSGNDRVYARGGNDLVYGGRGGDRLRGGAGNDVLHGSPGRDRLFGGPGSDVLRGGPRGDRLNTRDHVGRNDAADGGAGNDSCRTDSRDRRRSC